MLLVVQHAARDQPRADTCGDIRYPCLDHRVALLHRLAGWGLRDAPQRVCAHGIIGGCTIHDRDVPALRGDVPTEREVHHRRSSERAPQFLRRHMRCAALVVQRE